MRLPQYAVVRICKLLRRSDEYDGWGVNRRPPAVGDTGAIVDILTAPGIPDGYVVENVNPDAGTEWLGIFSAEELALVSEH